MASGGSVKVTDDDQVLKRLENKVTSSDNSIQFNVQNPGADEVLDMTTSGGSSGYSGRSGFSGFSGNNPGSSGFSGFSGANPGASGFSGRSGYSGYSGATSTSGFSGYSGGTSGFSGYSGRSGYSGANPGASGYSGYSGSGGSGGAQWLTPETFQGAYETGDGTERTLNDLGITLLEANEMAPLTAANYPGGIFTSLWTIDDLCMQEMLYTQETIAGGQWSWCTSGKWYVYNVPHYLPATNPNRLFEFGFSWNGTRHTNNGFEGVTFDRMPADQAQAEDGAQNYIQYAYVFENFFVGSNDDVENFGIRLGASYGSIYKNVFFFGFNTASLTYFGLHNKFHNCVFAGNTYLGSYVSTGAGSGQSWGIGDGWTDASLTNSASNGTSFNGCHWTMTDGCLAGNAMYGTDQAQVGGDVNVVEGAATSINSMIFDSQGATVVRTFYVENIHIEHEVTTSWIQIVCHTQAVDAFISRINPFIGNADDRAIVEAQTSPTDIGNNGFITLRIKELSSRAQPLIFRSSGVNASGYNNFYFDYVYLTSNTVLTTAANWDTDTIGGVTAVIPPSANLAYLQYP